MKTIHRLILISLLLTVLLAIPSPVFAQGPDQNGKVVFGGSYNLASGETLEGNLAVFGGTASINKGAKIRGDIFVTGGTLEINGEITGDVIAIGGSVSLGETAVIGGNLTTVNAAIRKASGAQVMGNTSTQTPGTFNFGNIPLDKLPFTISPGSIQPKINLSFLSTIGDILLIVLKSLALSALAVLLMLFLVKPTERVAETIVKQPFVSGGLGLLTLVIAPALLILLAITIVLSPLALIGLLLIIIAIVYGWIVIGYEVGKRLSVLLKWECAAPVCAGVGTLFMTLVVGVIGLIPCIGWLASALIYMLGLGGVLLSRFGTLDVTLNSSTPPTPPTPPIPPIPSARTIAPTIATPTFLEDTHPNDLEESDTEKNE